MYFATITSYTAVVVEDKEIDVVTFLSATDGVIGIFGEFLAESILSHAEDFRFSVGV